MAELPAAVRPTYAEVDLGAVAHNLALARALAPGTKICAVVKADAYGHGLVRVGRALAAAGADLFGVALVEEGVALRQGGVRAPILVWGAGYGGGEAAIVAHDLIPAVSDAAQLPALSAAAAAAGRVLPVHLEVDTGMARLGVDAAQAPALARACAAHEHLRLVGTMSHLACADAAADPFSAAQLARLDAVTAAMAATGCPPGEVHVGNSPALVSLPAARRALVRCGLVLYGLNPMRDRPIPGLRPAMRLASAVVAIRAIATDTPVSYGCRWRATRPSLIGTLAVGYGDGLPRLVSGRAHVLVRGHAAPLVGTVCMDLCMVDLTDVPGAAVGDEAILIGRQGDGEISADAVAGWAETISYEVLCGIGARVPRRYV